ncbi:glutathione S-transferase family protein [Puniceibacterium confluentis]|uniref:glutathione S-transferase family protein n=1 Tax=Puniceibacterium confluentis TaxID=1958944 RepID=UPI0011B85223|nr:glutathione S-transferase family protein [Puniceibacterium confluentis]
MTPEYRLHYAPDNASLIIRLALLELRAPFDTVLVDRASRAQDGAAYRRVNPVGRIPALETPQGPIFETAAILLWLADRHGALMPAADDPARGAALSWLFFLSNTLHAELRMLFYPEIYAGPGAGEQIRAPLTAGLQRHLSLLNRQAATDTGSFGSAHALALDLYLAPLLRWCALYPAGHTDWFDLQTYPALAELAARLEARDTVRAAAHAEGLGPRPFTAPRHAIPPIGSAT